jgi:hypothetical protein
MIAWLVDQIKMARCEHVFDQYKLQPVFYERELVPVTFLQLDYCSLCYYVRKTKIN